MKCNDALIQVGLKTGLALLFNLIRRDWEDGRGLSNDVLRTARDTILNLPPLSLSHVHPHSNKIGPQVLNEVVSFLDTSIRYGKVHDEAVSLCSDLILAIYAQTGNLSLILLWIRAALHAPHSINVSHDIFRQIMKLINPRFKFQPSSSNEPLNHYNASLLLLHELVKQTSKYSIISLIPDDDDDDDDNEDDNCLVYLWGSNSSHQLGEGSFDKNLEPRISNVIDDVYKLEAGQYCTFVIHKDGGKVSSCGKGCFGRLGLGNSKDSSTLRDLEIDKPVKALSSSKGSDGHTLALTKCGQVYSWGDGEFGKLGHGSNITHKSPTQILTLKDIVAVSTGFRHSAAVSKDGKLFTWGEGDYGRLGHGNTSSEWKPVQISSSNLTTNAVAVSCGAAHTLVLDHNGDIWSFGSADHGKLGLGHLSAKAIYKPKRIDNLSVSFIKVIAGSTYSVALSVNQRVYVWGSGPCLGSGDPEAKYYSPTPISSLENIVDVSVGESHVLALSCDGSVWSWGLNTMGQCGLGHSESPVNVPTQIPDLEGIRQISAGTSHSIAWTSPALDKRFLVLNGHKSFTVELSKSTLESLTNLLNDFGLNWDNDQDIILEPFKSKQDRLKFVSDILKLFSSHFTLASRMSNTNDLVPKDKAIVEATLYKFIDCDAVPREILDLVYETLSIGSKFLLSWMSVGQQIDLACPLIQLPNQSITRGQELKILLLIKSLNEAGPIQPLSGINAYKHDPCPSQTTAKLLLILLDKSFNYLVSLSLITRIIIIILISIYTFCRNPRYQMGDLQIQSRNYWRKNFRCFTRSTINYFLLTYGTKEFYL